MADILRGTATCVVIGAVVILMPASSLPHGFGYDVALAAFLLGLRFGHHAVGMLFAGTLAVGIAQLAGRGGCTPASGGVSCGFAAATPFLIFGYFVVPTLAGALLALALCRPAQHGPLRGGHTLSVAVAAGVTTFVACALLPHSGATMLLPSLAGCLAAGLAPSYGVERVPAPAARAGPVSWW